MYVTKSADTFCKIELLHHLLFRFVSKCKYCWLVSPMAGVENMRVWWRILSMGGQHTWLINATTTWRKKTCLFSPSTAPTTTSCPGNIGYPMALIDVMTTHGWWLVFICDTRVSWCSAAMRGSASRLTRGATATTTVRIGVMNCIAKSFVPLE